MIQSALLCNNNFAHSESLKSKLEFQSHSPGQSQHIHRDMSDTSPMTMFVADGMAKQLSV